MPTIIDNWYNSFFTEIILIAVLILCFLTAFKLKTRQPVLSASYLHLYPLSFLIIIIISYIAAILCDNKILQYNQFSLESYADYFFTLVEMLIFMHFFSLVLKNKSKKKILIFVQLFFIVYFIIELFLNEKFPNKITNETQSRVYTTEAIILLIPCVMYFIELFRTPSSSNLKFNPSFWIVSGLFFFLICTLPYSLVENYLRKKHLSLLASFYSLFYIFYIIFFLMITKAYLCKPVKTI